MLSYNIHQKPREYAPDALERPSTTQHQRTYLQMDMGSSPDCILDQSKHQNQSCDSGRYGEDVLPRHLYRHQHQGCHQHKVLFYISPRRIVLAFAVGIYKICRKLLLVRVKNIHFISKSLENLYVGSISIF